MDSGTPADASISLAELEAQITELAGHLNAANYRWLTLIGQFDRRNGWADGKLPSCAHWLNFKCGLNLGAARERIRVAHALTGLPKIAASMARGELSYSKVRALTRVACETTEESFLMIALHGAAHHVERLVRGYRRAQDAEELSREAQQHTHRSVRYGFAEDGSLILKARLPALAGALLIEALDAALERVPDHEISAEREEECTLSFEHRRADALAAVAESYLAASDTASDTASHTAGRCEIENGPALPAETVRRLTCDASLLHLLENEHGEPLDVGRKTRSIPPAIRRALNSRDGGWRFLHPDGRHFEIIRCTSPDPCHGEELEHTHTALGIHIDPDTAATRWRGERLDYDLGVWVLCQPHAGAPGFDMDDGVDVSAETFKAEQDVETDGEWWRHDKAGTAYLTSHS
jgi:Domain of unknown function (DUF222)